MAQSISIRNITGAPLNNATSWREQNLKHWMEVQGAKQDDSWYRAEQERAKGRPKGLTKRTLDTQQTPQAVDYITGQTVNPGQDLDDSVGREALNRAERHRVQTIRGAAKKDEASSELGEMLRDQGARSEQGRWVVTNKEHAKSVSGEPGQKPVASPTQYKTIQRGSNSPRSQFTGSGRYNVTMQDRDSFTPEQMRRLGRPSNPLEDAVDFELQEAFGNKDFIDITDNDWRRIQQGIINDDELIAHKLAVKDAEAQGYVWIDAEFDEDQIIAIDEQMGKKSLVKHHRKRTKRDLQIEQKEWADKAKKGYKTTQLPRGRFQKVAGRVSKAEALAMMGLHVASGNIPGVLISAGSLSAQLAAQNPTVQKKAIDLGARIIARRGAKSAAKLIPGVDILISGKEAFDYASQGRFDQAALAALSGAIGWVPGVGDLGAALIDMTNTAIDVSRGDFKSVAQKQTEATQGEVMKVNRKGKPITQADVDTGNYWLEQLTDKRTLRSLK